MKFLECVARKLPDPDALYVRMANIQNFWHCSWPRLGVA